MVKELYTEKDKERDLVRLDREIKELEILIDECKKRDFSKFNILSIIQIKNIKKERLAQVKNF